MAYWESNGHVTDGVTWPWNVKVMTPIRLVQYIEKLFSNNRLSLDISYAAMQYGLYGWLS